jgi:uncharacterized protein (UPF0335 family)
MTAQDIVKDVATRIQNIDEQIRELQIGKAEIMKQAKTDGINTTLLARAIAEVRRDKKTPPAEKSETELYSNLVQDIIQVLE